MEGFIVAGYPRSFGLLEGPVLGPSASFDAKAAKPRMLFNVAALAKRSRP
jgi:hypothetical protein